MDADTIKSSGSRGALGSFWNGAYKQKDEHRRVLYDELGDDPRKIFPIRFAAEPGLATGQIAGSIPGFCWQPKDKVEVYY